MPDASAHSESQRLRIQYWCQFFWPEISAPSRRLLDFGKVWQRRGHDVTVVTGMPNHPDGVTRQGYRGRVTMSERKDGIRVQRSWVYASANAAGVRKLIGHLSFAVSSLLMSGWRGRRPNVVVVSSPTFFVAFSAWAVARLRRAAFVFEVRDLWPEAFVDLGVLSPGPVVRLLNALVLFLYRRADRVVVVTEAFAARIAGLGIPGERIVTITNGADVAWFAADVGEVAARRRRDLGLERRFVAAYIGAHGVSQGLMSVLDAAQAARDEAITFLLVGGGSERAALQSRCRERGLTNVVMLPPQPAESIREWYALADVCLVPLRDVPVFETFIPSKMFEIMAAGRPMVGAVRGEARDILERSGAAVLVSPEDPVALLDAVRSLVDAPQRCREMGAAGRAFVARHYSREALGARYERVLSEVAR